MSKGSNQRPRQIKQDEFAARWDEVFGNKTDERLVVVDRRDLIVDMDERRGNVFFGPTAREETPAKPT